MGAFKGFRGTVLQEEGDHTIVRLRGFDRDAALVTFGADKLGPDDGGGRAGVREPRRPLPFLDDTAADLPQPREAEQVEPPRRRARSARSRVSAYCFEIGRKRLAAGNRRAPRPPTRCYEAFWRAASP
jgi:hypothetical protein